MPKKLVLILYVLVWIFATGCNKTISEDPVSKITPPANPSRTWIDAPLPNSNLPLLPYNIVFHGASFVGVTEFEIKINGIFTAAVTPTSSSSGGAEYGTLFLGEYLWTPPTPGTYLISVRAKGNEQFSPPDQVQVTISGETVKDTTPLIEDPTPLPTHTFTPTFTPTAEEAEPCTLTAQVNLFCRPGPEYEPIDSFTPGQSMPVIAQSSDLWKVIGANNGRECTVPKGDKFVEISGYCDDIPEFTPLSPPTATPTNTPSPTFTVTPEEGCNVLQESGAIECIVPCPVGAEPGDACTP